MPHYLVERYTPNAAWHALSEAQRTAFIQVWAAWRKGELNC
ncbi:hypothetical protein ACMYSK_06930 [Klebsiella sp. I138]